MFDKSARQDGTFTYDYARDLYLCPGGKALTTTGAGEEGLALWHRPRVDVGSDDA